MMSLQPALAHNNLQEHHGYHQQQFTGSQESYSSASSVNDMSQKSFSHEGSHASISPKPADMIEEYTPPSSASQPDTNDQSHKFYSQQRNHPYALEARTRTPVEAAGTHTSSPAPSSPSEFSGSPPTTQGSKRTASGAVKFPNGPYIMRSPEQGRRGFHSRTLSKDTTTSTVGELSAQLKARLSYAMAKVQQNGRLPPSPQATSPMLISTPSMSTPRDNYNYNNVGDSTMMAATGRPAAISTMMNNTTRQSQNLSRIVQDAGSDNHWSSDIPSPPFARKTQPESYERVQALPNPPAGLAPAPDFKAPTLDSRLSKPNGINRANGHTPRHIRKPTLQEQEAVDTLIFLSSPKNTGRFPSSRDAVTSGSHTHPHAQQQQSSPLRSEFARPVLPSSIMRPPNLKPRNSASSDENEAFMPSSSPRQAIKPASTETSRQVKRRSLGLGVLKTTKDVDHLLDEMADDGEDFIIPSSNIDRRGPGDVYRGGFGPGPEFKRPG